MRLFRVRHYRRTCRACGHVWDIPRALANERMPSRREFGELSRPGSRPSLLRPFGGLPAGAREKTARKPEDTVARRREIVAKLERIDRNSRCPECGQREYEQKVV